MNPTYVKFTQKYHACDALNSIKYLTYTLNELENECQTLKAELANKTLSEERLIKAKNGPFWVFREKYTIPR